ncbi:MAG: B12-binding domain-containing radical SAM protein [Nanoarchaeota archaeon]|nr:B12-binding domain-containing radical SAM protein [Nanoarchaeota archaeon]
MKIMLVYPPAQVEDTYSNFSFAAPVLPPLGLAYLGAVLEKAGFDVKIVDCVAERLGYKELLEAIREYKPSIVGFNANTISYPKVQKALPLIKKVNADIVTVIGGAHSSAMPRQVLAENPDLDVAVFGEGECTILEIANRLKAGLSLNNIDGTAIMSQEKIIVNNPRQLIENLDTLPFPARHLLKDLRTYSHTPLRGTGFIVSVITSRGCPFNCFYCDQSVFTRKWRANSVDYVISEIKMLKEKYGADAISFEDDNFALSKERVIGICKRMISENLGMKWSCCIRIDKIDEEILGWMKQAGCTSIYVGIESGNQEMLNSINKNLSIEQIKLALKTANKAGIDNIYGSFILGLPRDTKETIEQTINFACNLPLTGISFNIFTPYPNTKLREIASKFGVIKEDWKNYSDHAHFAPYIPNGITEEELLMLQKRAYRKFFIRPSYIINHLKYIFNIHFMKDAICALFLFFRLSKNRPKSS